MPIETSSQVVVASTPSAAPTATPVSGEASPTPLPLLPVSSLLTAVPWNFKKIFSASGQSPYNSDIPPPASNPGSWVQGVYSESVVYSRANKMYYMFFGVSVYCNSGNVARDSIALAHSADGLSFTFDRYLIEPNSDVCSPSRVIPATEILQLNDPSTLLTLVNGQETVYMAYTAGIDSGCGNIGMAAFNIGTTGPELNYRNDLYLQPGSYCNSSGGYGFSRPSLERVPGGSVLWFDTNLGIFKTPVANVNQLDNSTVVNAGVSGVLDIEVYRIGQYDFLLANGAKGVVDTYTSLGPASWSPFGLISSTSGQGWDNSQQGNGQFLVNPDTHQVFFYLAGVDLSGSQYLSIDIGVGTLPVGSDLNQQLYQLLCASTNDSSLCP